MKMTPQYNGRIHNFTSFKTVTTEPVARLYFYFMLDPLVELAYQVSCDFFQRPHFYTKLGDASVSNGETESVSNVLARLHSRLGSNELFPSSKQRNEIYFPIFGGPPESATGKTNTFLGLRNVLMEAAAAFAGNAVDTGVEVLRESVRSSARPLRNYLAQLRGDSVKWSAEKGLSHLTEEVCYAVFRSSGVAGVFGITIAPDTNWPYVEDSNGDKLVEAMSNQLGPFNDSVGNPRKEELFSNLQGAALRGAEALATIADFKDSDGEDIDPLIRRVYSWRSALSAFKAGSITGPQGAIDKSRGAMSGSTSLYPKK
jgi:hypothetical protein